MESVVMVFSGDYDVACKEQLRGELERLVALQNVVLDFRDVTYIDSTIVSELIRMHKLRAENLFEPEIIFVGNNQNIQWLFDVLQLHKVFRLVSSLEGAVRKGVPVVRSFAGHGSLGRTPTRPDVTDGPSRQVEGAL
jgi:anti-anti-sigma factor